MLEPAEHLARRKLELPSFHGESVTAYADRIRELAEAEVAGWRPGEVVSVHLAARRLTLAVILELVLGVRDDALRAQIVSAFDSLNSRAANLAQFMPLWMTARTWWNLPARLAYARIDRIRDLLVAHVGRTRTDPGLEQRGDVLALLVRARDEDGAALTDIDLRDELMTLVAAGHETTATSIAWAADLLAHNPEVAARLRDTLAAGDREYLRATAKEILRVRTVVYAGGARRLLDPLPAGSWVLPPGTVVLIDAQGLHADPELYPDPEAFRPERFLDSQPEPYAYVPFGGGAHRCLGAALATLDSSSSSRRSPPASASLRSGRRRRPSARDQPRPGQRGAGPDRGFDHVKHPPIGWPHPRPGGPDRLSEREELAWARRRPTKRRSARFARPSTAT